LLPIAQYTESTADSTRYEGLLAGETKPVFPHDLSTIRQKDPDLIRKTPFGNTFTKELAIEAIKGENLGKGDATDFLAISFSSTDYVGHIFGTRSIELEDTYLRLDQELEELLTFLDNWAGKGKYLVFLTADHGAAENALYCGDEKLPGGNMQFSPVNDSLESLLEKKYGPGRYILNGDASGIYLDRKLIAERTLSWKK
jgi:predicted AlkP superfamily pyrophosphatase or phosphodiesterase